MKPKACGTLQLCKVQRQHAFRVLSIKFLRNALLEDAQELSHQASTSPRPSRPCHAATGKHSPKPLRRQRYSRTNRIVQVHICFRFSPLKVRSNRKDLWVQRTYTSNESAVPCPENSLKTHQVGDSWKRACRAAPLMLGRSSSLLVWTASHASQIQQRRTRPATCICILLQPCCRVLTAYRHYCRSGSFSSSVELTWHELPFTWLALPKSLSTMGCRIKGNRNLHVLGT